MNKQKEYDAGNYQMVCLKATGDEVTVIRPRAHMTIKQALVHAAWIVTLADPSGEEFKKALAAVQDT